MSYDLKCGLDKNISMKCICVSKNHPVVTYIDGDIQHVHNFNLIVNTISGPVLIIAPSTPSHTHNLNYQWLTQTILTFFNNLKRIFLIKPMYYQFRGYRICYSDATSSFYVYLKLGRVVTESTNTIMFWKMQFFLCDL